MGEMQIVGRERERERETMTSLTAFFFLWQEFGVGRVTRMPHILTDGAYSVKLGDLIDTKLIHWGLNVFNVYIEDKNEMKLILWGPKRLISPTKSASFSSLTFSWSSSLYAIQRVSHRTNKLTSARQTSFGRLVARETQPHTCFREIHIFWNT